MTPPSPPPAAAPPSPLCTFAEAEQERRRSDLALTFLQRLQWNEEMCRLAARLAGAAGGPEGRRRVLTDPRNVGLLAYLTDEELAALGIERPRFPAAGGGTA